MFEEEKNKVAYIDLSEKSSEKVAEVKELLNADKIDEARFIAIQFCQKCKSVSSILEMQCYDADSLKKVALTIADYYYDKNDILSLTLWLQLLFQLPDQLTQVNIGFVNYLTQKTDNLKREQQQEIFNWILKCTNGKLYLENERASVAVKLAAIYETEDQYAPAIKLLESIPYETNMKVDLKDRLEYLINQMRLIVKAKSYAKLGVISNKFPKKSVKTEGLETIHAMYLLYMFYYYNYKLDLNSYISALTELLEIDFDKIDFVTIKATFLPESLQHSDENDIRRYFEYGILFFALLIPYSKTNNIDLKVYQKRLYATLSHCSPLFKLYNKVINEELIPFNSEIIKQVLTQPFFNDRFFIHEEGLARKLLEKSLMQKSLMLVSKYYTQVQFKSLSRILQLSKDTIEDVVCEMVREDLLKARINQLEDKVVFLDNANRNDLARWYSGIEKFIKLYSECPEISLKNRIPAK